MNSPEPFSNVRPPAVAGKFYPDDPQELRLMVEQFLEGAHHRQIRLSKAYVLPHAGYAYSGPVAATGYRELGRQAATVDQIVLLGPSHRVSFHGLAFSSHDAFATPLGLVRVNREAIETLRDLPQVVEMDQAHRDEHSLEVHLPFLQVALGEFSVVPLVVGSAGEEEVCAVLERLWGDERTRIIISSDLSHYHDDRTACTLDRETARQIENLEAVVPDQACGATPLGGLLRSARKRHMTMTTLDLRNSGDTAGPRDRVVGYGAFAAS